MEKKNIGFIGAGARALGFARNMIFSDYNLHVVALCDKYEERMQESRKSLEAVNASINRPSNIQLYSDYKKLIDNTSIDFVFITSPQYFHEEPFRYALEKDKLIFCEKPLGHSEEAIKNMYQAWVDKDKKNVMLGFTRRYESTWRKAREIINNGQIGNVKMIQLRSIIPHSAYFHKWYGQTKYSGGLLNEKCAHHFDVINWFAASVPKMISAMGSRSVYTPKDGCPKWCKDCNRNCEYRFSHEEAFESERKKSVPLYMKTAVDSEDILLAKDKCVYSKDIDIVDHAITNISYDNGINAQLFFSIFGYHTDDRESLEVIGDSGKLRFDRYSGIIKVDYDFGREHMEIDGRDENFNDGTGHCGADLVIIDKINDFIRKGIRPPADVYDGYIASRMSFLAIKSCHTNKVYEI